MLDNGTKEDVAFAATPLESQASDATVGVAEPISPRDAKKLQHSESFPSESSASSVPTDGDPNAQRLRFETITDREARVVTSCIKVNAGVCLVGIVIFAILKSSSKASERFVLNRSYHIVSLSVAVVCASSLLAMSSFYAYRVCASVRAGRSWSKRRASAVTMMSARGTTMLVVTSAYTASHATVLADPTSVCSARSLAWLGAIRWIGWNCMLLMIIVEAHGLVPVRGAGGRIDGSIRDLGWRRHWRKLILWGAFTALVLWMGVQGIQDDHIISIKAGWQGCEWGAQIECTVPRAVLAGSVLSIIGVGVYTALFVHYIAVSWRALQAELYQRFRLWNMLWQIQVRLNGVVLLVFLLGVCLLWFLGGNPCVNYTVTWLGIMPLVVVMTGLQLMGFYVAMPRPQSHVHDVSACVWLMQQFAWTERSMPRKLAERMAHAGALWEGAGQEEPEAGQGRIHCGRAAGLHLRTTSAEGGRRNGALPGEGAAEDGTKVTPGSTGPSRGSTCSLAALRTHPMFCFETCIKLFFWAALIYSYTEAEGADFSTLPEAIRALLGEVGEAMALFGLVSRRLFYDRKRGTKVLVAWNERTIVVSVRGSAERANFYEDAKFLQTVHPPRRKGPGGGVPRVHRGFLTTWTANGIGAAVLRHVCALVRSSGKPESVRILFTGHSLGGAVAQLAAFDTARALRLQPRQLTVYTFGCPRIGNHALAAEYAVAVPDTWHIINGQDIVTQGMKVLGLYKRAGTRVIVNSKGDLIVHPTLLELSLLQHPFGGSVAHHYTPAYQESLVAIITAQLDATRSHADGLEGLLALLRDVPIVRTALEAHAARVTGGKTLVDTLRDIGAAALHPMGTGSRRSLLEQTLIRQHHENFTRAAGGDAGLAALLAEPDGLAGASGSAGEREGDEVTEAEALVVQPADREAVDDAESTAKPVHAAALTADGEGAVVQRGDDASEGSGRSGVSRVCYLGDAAAIAGMAQKEGASRWHSAGARVRGALAVSRWLQGGGEGADAPTARVAEAASAEPPPAALRDSAVAAEHGGARRALAHCYVIPEEEGGVGGGDSRARERWKRLHSWRCPLSAPASELPPNARLHGSVLEIGAAPDMRRCRGFGAHSSPELPAAVSLPAHDDGSGSKPRGAVQRTALNHSAPTLPAPVQSAAVQAAPGAPEDSGARGASSTETDRAVGAGSVAGQRAGAEAP